MNYEQSVTRAVIAVVQEMGEATYEQVAERISAHPAERVRRALQNAKERGLLVVARMTKGERQRRGLAVYAKAKEGPPQPARKRYPSDLRRLSPTARPAPPASVWDLGAARVVPMWPPAWEGGREYLLLGPEEEEAEAQAA